MRIDSINRRIAELWSKQRKDELNASELDELTICMNAHANYYWKLSKLENLSLMASMTNDTDWLHEICNRIEELEN